MEVEHELCLVEPPLELMEEVLLQVQMQVMEEMQDMEALEVGVVLEEAVETHTKTLILLLIIQEEMEVSVEQEVMGAVAAEVAAEATLGLLAAIFQEQEIRQELVALEEEVEAAEMLEGLAHKR